MKSIMEEASSIFKAVEKAWERAGKPQEFSIKVLEMPEKNFFGFTTRYAKIALIFSDIKSQQRHYVADNAHENKQKRQQKKVLPVQIETRIDQVRTEKTKQPKNEKLKQSHITIQQSIEKREVPQDPIWSSELITTARVWLEEFLVILDKQSITFSTEARRYYLHVVFKNQITASTEQEQQLFRSCAHVLMQILRSKSKKQLRGCKIVFSTES